MPKGGTGGMCRQVRKRCVAATRGIFRTRPAAIGQTGWVTADDDSTPLRASRLGELLTHRIAKIGAIAATLAGGAAWAFGGPPHVANGASPPPPNVASIVDPQPARATEEPEPEQRPAPEPGALSDPELGALVVKRLRWDTHVDATLVHVEVDDARVALSGTVATDQQRERSIANAWIAGVQDVDATALEVQRRDRAARLPKPARIERAILAAFAVDPALAGADVQVALRGHVVLLRGRVDNLAAARAAELVATHAPGVAAVTNEIAIAPRADDEAIAADVTQALATSPETAALGIEVRSRGGAVVLEGADATFDQRIAAEATAARIRGVQALDNRLRIRTGEVAFYYDPHPSLRPAAERSRDANARPRRDDDIAAAIRAELQWSRDVGNAPIEIAVRRGTATLSGDVETTAIHDAVLWNAYQGGAKAVVDRLFVAEDPRPKAAPQADPGDVIFGRD
jgi:osmotically-inducible protein OsmY